MPEKPLKKLVKNPLKPHGTGILRFQVLNCLMVMGVPMRVSDIEGWLRKQKGVRHSLPTIYQALYEISIAFDHIELHSATVSTREFKAEVYSVSFIKKPKNNNSCSRSTN